MPVVELLHSDDGERLFWYCPGCEYHHAVPVDQGGWQWNRNLERPTLSPSVRHRVNNTCCHYFIRDGQIQYCGDCTHELAGQTIAMEQVEQ